MSRHDMTEAEAKVIFVDDRRKRLVRRIVHLRRDFGAPILDGPDPA